MPNGKSRISTASLSWWDAVGMRHYGNKQKKVKIKKPLTVKKFKGLRLKVKFCIFITLKNVCLKRRCLNSKSSSSDSTSVFFLPSFRSVVVEWGRTRRRSVRTEGLSTSSLRVGKRDPSPPAARHLKCSVCFSVASSRETEEEAGEDGGPAGQKRAAEEAAQGSGTSIPCSHSFYLILLPPNYSMHFLVWRLWGHFWQIVYLKWSNIWFLSQCCRLKVCSTIPSDSWRFNVQLFAARVKLLLWWIQCHNVKHLLSLRLNAVAHSHFPIVPAEAQGSFGLLLFRQKYWVQRQNFLGFLERVFGFTVEVLRDS